MTPTAITVDGMSEVGDPTRLSPRKWYLLSVPWSLILLQVVVVAVTSDRPAVVRVLVVAAVVAYGACYVQGVLLSLQRPRIAPVLVTVMVVLWMSLLVGTDAGSRPLYIVSFVVVPIVIFLPPARGVAVAGLVCLAGVGTVWLLEGTVGYAEVISMVVIVLAMSGMFGIVRVNAQLREAREELAVMAVTAERERMARELHDVLGHSLTTITVKAGLARRLLESGDAERAAVEVADMERLGRQALAEVRSTVSANRVASLAREVTVAREALRAAEIGADLPVAIDDVPAERQQAFAYVVREGVTNVIRHSGASRCTVRLTPESVEVRDDGVGSPAGTPAGNGISGLTERLAAVGGWVDAGPMPDGGYRLRAECLPARKGARA